jgi:RloB-like protein
MGRDNAPQARQRQHLARKQARRVSHDRILIVSEGSKTEPLYFKDVRAAYRLHTASVAVRPSELGTAPIQVVQYAHDLFMNGDPHAGRQPRAFEEVYAVFDRDDHASYFDALQRAEALNGKLRNDAKQAVTFKAIASVPSFELWLLLHFADVHAPMHRDQVLQQMKQHMPGYQKGADGVFARTCGHLPLATARAALLATQFSAHTAPEPYTAVAELVTRLTTLRG